MLLRLIRELFRDAVLRCFWNYYQVAVILEKQNTFLGNLVKIPLISILCFYCIGDVTFATHSVGKRRIVFCWPNRHHWHKKKTNQKTTHLMPTAKMGEIYNSVLGKMGYWKVILRGITQWKNCPSIVRIIIFLRASIKLP